MFVATCVSVMVCPNSVSVRSFTCSDAVRFMTVTSQSVISNAAGTCAANCRVSPLLSCA